MIIFMTYFYENNVRNVEKIVNKYLYTVVYGVLEGIVKLGQG